jgi:hypothetical protein
VINFVSNLRQLQSQKRRTRVSAPHGLWSAAVDGEGLGALLEKGYAYRRNLPITYTSTESSTLTRIEVASGK